MKLKRFVLRALFFVVATVLVSVFILFCLVQCRRETLTYPTTVEDSLIGTATGELQEKNREEMAALGLEWADEQSLDMWHLKSFDGLDLQARFFKNENSHSYVIFVHGYHDSFTRFYNYAYRLFDMGYNVLMIAQRSHSPSEGRFITMGYYESEDLKDWTSKLAEYDPDAKIGIVGLSLGATTAFMASGLELPENVKCIVADSGFSSVKELYKDKLEKFHLTPEPIIGILSFYTRVFAGWDIYKDDTKSRLPNAKVPILFIHGRRDIVVPIDNLERVVSFYGGPEYKTLIFDDMGHIKAFFTYPEKYFGEVGAFLKEHI